MALGLLQSFHVLRSFGLPEIFNIAQVKIALEQLIQKDARARRTKLFQCLCLCILFLGVGVPLVLLGMGVLSDGHAMSM